MRTGERVGVEREAQGLTQNALAQKVTRLGWKISQTGIDKLEKRSSERPRCLPELAKALNVTERWLQTGREPKHPQEVPAEGPAAQRVAIVAWVSAGKLSEQDVTDVEIGHTTIGGLDARGDWVALRVDGDSMDRISPPDSVIVINRKDKRLVSNACYVVADLDGKATYKRFRSNPPRFEPVSTNPNHEPIFFDNDPVIVGRVRRSIVEM